MESATLNPEPLSVTRRLFEEAESHAEGDGDTDTLNQCSCCMKQYHASCHVPKLGPIETNAATFFKWTCGSCLSQIRTQRILSRVEAAAKRPLSHMFFTDPSAVGKKALKRHRFNDEDDNDIAYFGGAQPFRRRVSGLPSNRPLPSFSVVDEDVEVIQYETGKEVDVDSAPGTPVVEVAESEEDEIIEDDVELQEAQNQENERDNIPIQNDNTSRSEPVTQEAQITEETSAPALTKTLSVMNETEATEETTIIEKEAENTVEEDSNECPLNVEEDSNETAPSDSVNSDDIAIDNNDEIVECAKPASRSWCLVM